MVINITNSRLGTKEMCIFWLLGERIDPAIYMR